MRDPLISLALGVSLLMEACAFAGQRLGSDGAPTPLLGSFEDDYGNQFRISRDEWVQLPNTRFRVVSWRPGEQYLVAQNDAGNPSDPGLWTRIDWMMLDSMPPYRWAFCLSAYKAASREAAQATSVAHRDAPKTGCNRFPFSRMRRLAERPALQFYPRSAEPLV